jgi:hypothetical protein
MKPEVVLELLEKTADQLGIRVSYEALATTVMHGGLCKVKGAYRIIVDKRATCEERVITLATALATFETSTLDIAPKVREVMRRYSMSDGAMKRKPQAA